MRRNFVQFCAKTNVTSTAHQFQFSLAFFAVHFFFVAFFCAYLWSRLAGIFACACKCWISIKCNCAISFDRIIFIRGFRHNHRRHQFLRPLIHPRRSRNSLGFRWIYCRQTSNLRLPAASFCVLFVCSGTKL